MTGGGPRVDGTSSPRGVGRVRLDRETILAGALELASQSRVSAISFRELGAHLGVDPTAFYRHFRSKEELMKELLDHVTLLGLAEIDVPAEDWRGTLRALAAATLRQFERYPAIGLEAVVLTTNGPGEHTAIETMLDAFSRAGLSGEELVRHYALLAGHVLSAAANIARARAERSEDENGFWLSDAILVDPREFPLIAAHIPLLADLRDEEMFLAGVDMILDSAERTAAERTAAERTAAGGQSPRARDATIAP